MALDYEEKYYKQGIKFIVGVDEAGRGPLLGPVVAGAVILPPNFKSELINDSKKLSAKKRNEAYELIVEVALAYAVGIVSAKEIDEINIYQASRLAMTRAIEKLNHQYEMILSDAMPLPSFECPVEAIIKGDAKASCIAAASIIAKVTRDKMMDELDEMHPQYGIKNHKGYPTKEHLEALNKYGPIPEEHRFTYRPLKKFRK